MAYTNYKQLQVWQKAMNLTVEVYRLAKMLPREETYALSDQMRRAAISIPSNIAEGSGRNSTKEFAHFLGIAQGSKAELETQLQLCVKIGYIAENEISSAMSLSNEVGKMLTTLILKAKA